MSKHILDSDSEDTDKLGAERVNEGGDASPETVEEVTPGGGGIVGHGAEVGPRGLLDKAVSDADIGSCFDPGGIQQISQRAVSVGVGPACFQRHQLQIVGPELDIVFRRCR